MAPSVARSGAGAALAIGSPGADRITTALMQVLARYCHHGVSLQEAIDAPRVHVRILDDASTRVDHEDDDEIAAAVEQAGLPAFTHGPISMFFGGVGAAARGRTGSSSPPATPAARPRPASPDRPRP